METETETEPVGYNDLYRAILGISIVSMVFIFITVLLYFLYRKNSSTRAELLIYLCLSTFFSSVSYILPWNTSSDYPSLCTFQGILMVIAETGQYLWAGIIGFHTTYSIRTYKDGNMKLSKKLRFIYWMIGFGFPIILSIVLYAIDRIGFKGPWCWIRIEEKGDILGQGLQIFFYFIFFGSGVLNIFFALYLFNYISKDGGLNEAQKRKNRGLVCKMFRHPIILVVMILPTVIIRVCTIEEEGWEGTEVVNSIGIIGISSFGVISVFSYGFTCDFINMLKEIASNKSFLNLNESTDVINFNEDEISNFTELKLNLKG